MCCVRPGVFEAKARRRCCVSVLIAVDLPAFDRPTKAISGSSVAGSCVSSLAVVRKRAVCAQASAAFSSLAGLRSVMALIVKSAGFAPEKTPTVMKLATLLTGLLIALTTIAAAADNAAHAPAAAKPDLAKGEATSNGVCVACHTNDGSRGSPANPILQGQHAEYLVQQLTEFKADKRQHPVMKGLASALSEQDMKNVAPVYGSKQA